MCRLIINGRNNPFWNMAVDEAIYQAVIRDESLSTLRLYQWQEAISFGYFQNPAEEIEIEKAKHLGINYVRRLTGGGIIYHHKELTFSVVLDLKKFRKLLDINETYKIFAEVFLEVLSQLGIKASQFVSTSHQKNLKQGVCFLTPAPSDILVDHKKVIGYAQRRRKNVMLLQSSILLNTQTKEMAYLLKNSSSTDISNYMIGLKEIKKNLTLTSIKKDIINAFEKHFKVKLLKDNLSLKEKKLAFKLMKEKYQTFKWNHKFFNTKT